MKKVVPLALAAAAVVATLLALDPLGWRTGDPGERLAGFGEELVEGNERAFESQPCVRVLDEAGPLLEVSFRADGSRVRVAQDVGDVERYLVAVFDETNGEPGRQSPPEQVRSSWGGDTADAVLDSTTGWRDEGALVCLGVTLELTGGGRVQRVVGPAIGTRPAGAWHLLAWLEDRDVTLDWRVDDAGALSLRAQSAGEPGALEVHWGANVVITSPAGPVVMPASLVGALPTEGLRCTVHVLGDQPPRVELARWR